ncbi:hypothetical protein CMK11_05455 [Candidatus Poribacteria bacterium]|nr:hypothetical protein [Candidatus Poribacteria bacterium]
MGSGAAWLDYDRDGDLDIYFVNGADLPGKRSAGPPTNRLYRNDGGARFVDVTEEAGVGDEGYGFSCAAGDYDNDGFLDLYVTNFRADVLYRNDGDGSFTDVTRSAGIANDEWSASASFADYDNDGDIDLFVANYVQYRIDDTPLCGTSGVRLHCSPDVFPGTQSLLYRNNGDGTFTDVTHAAGLTNSGDKAMGVVWSDYDNDGDVDLFVANDRTPDRLYRNDGEGTFTDVALIAGIALSENGVAMSSMAAAFGDIDGDGWFDLAVTNYHDEPNMVFRNDGDGFFSDVTYQSGVGGEGMNFLSWGGEFADLDNDRDLDLFVTNGHMDQNVRVARPSLTYAQPNQLLENRGDGIFDDVSAFAGDGLSLHKVSRGAAFGDFDDDGDIDLLVTNCGQAPDLLRNDTPGGNHSLTFELVGVQSNRDGIGARIRVLVGGVWQAREVKSGGSYPCHSDMRLHFGLGEAGSADRVEIRWPSGLVEHLRDVSAGRLVRLEEGASGRTRSR